MWCNQLSTNWSGVQWQWSVLQVRPNDSVQQLLQQTVNCLSIIPLFAQIKSKGSDSKGERGREGEWRQKQNKNDEIGK